MSHWRRLALLSVLAVLAASCAEVGEEGHEAGLSYEFERTVQQAGLGDYDDLTWAMQVSNVNGKSVVITSVDLVRADGLEQTESLVVAAANRANLSGIFPGFPPRPYADRLAARVQPLASVVVPAHGERASAGVLVLVGFKRTSALAYASGWRVSGTVDGAPFVDMVDSTVIVCDHTGPRPTAECATYDEEVRQQLELPALPRQTARTDTLARVAP